MVGVGLEIMLAQWTFKVILAEIISYSFLNENAETVTTIILKVCKKIVSRFISEQ